MKIGRCIYISKEVWNEFLGICKREGEKASNKLEAYMQFYNNKHRVGNPQLLIENYVDVDKPKPMRVLCGWLDGAVTGGEVHCRKKQMWISAVQCYSCDQNRLRKQK